MPSVQNNLRNSNKKTLLLISIFLFLVSLILPTLYDLKGYHLVYIGALSLVFIKELPFVYGLFWLSNVIYFIGLFRFLKNKQANNQWFIIAFAVGVTFQFYLKSLETSDLPDRINNFNTLLIGYYCWLFSFISIPILSKIIQSGSIKTENENNDEIV